MLTTLTGILGWVCYGALGAIALWGAYCVVVVWRRVAEVRFRSETEQNEFLTTIDTQLQAGDLHAMHETCARDPRALPQLINLAMANRQLGYNKVRALLADRFQRDVLADLEYRVSWIQTVIRSAPMVGLFGTVIGMMGAFSKLAGEQNVEPKILADDISVALVTTACGLAIAIPLVLCTANINVRLRKLEDLVGAGLTRFLEMAKPMLSGEKNSQPANARSKEPVRS